MPAEFKDGTIIDYDSNTKQGHFYEVGTAPPTPPDPGLIVRTVRPVVTVQPGQSITVMNIPGGPVDYIGIIIDGKPV